MSSIEEVGARLSLKDRPAFSRGLRDVEGDIDRVGGAADRAGRHFSVLGGLAGGAHSAVSLVGSVARTAAVGVGVLTGAAVAAGVSMIGLASDAAEVESKFNTVFGTAGADQVNAWIRDIQGEVHIATDELQNAASTFGVFGQAVGVPASDLSTFSTNLAQAGLDLASFSNADPSDVFLALRSGLAGEAEPLRQFGIFLSDASLNAFAAAQGIGKTTQEMSEQEKVLLRQQFILANLGAAQGDLARTADGVANQQRGVVGAFRDFRVEIGQVLTPAVEQLLPLLTTGLEGVLNRLRENLPSLQERTRTWAQMVVRLYRTIRDGRIDTSGFDEQIEAVFGTRFGGFLNTAIDLVGTLRGNIEELGTRQGAITTIGDMFGPGAADVLDRVWTAFDQLGTVWRESIVPAWQGVTENLGPLAGLSFRVFSDVLGWAADHADQLIGPLEILFGTWIIGSTIGRIGQMAGAFRGLAGALTATTVASVGSSGAGGLLAALGSLSRFLATNPLIALLTAVAALIGITFVALSGEVGAAVDRAALSPEEINALEATNIARERQGLPPISQAELMASAPGASASPEQQHILDSIAIGRRNQAASGGHATVPAGTPITGGVLEGTGGAVPTPTRPASHPGGGGPQEFSGWPPIIIQAWDGEDVARLLNNNARALTEAVERGLQINRSRS
jgi:hypothetical protein